MSDNAKTDVQLPSEFPVLLLFLLSAGSALWAIKIWDISPPNPHGATRAQRFLVFSGFMGVMFLLAYSLYYFS